MAGFPPKSPEVSIAFVSRSESTLARSNNRSQQRSPLGFCPFRKWLPRNDELVWRTTGESQPIGMAEIAHEHRGELSSEY